MTGRIHLVPRQMARSQISNHHASLPRPTGLPSRVPTFGYLLFSYAAAPYETSRKGGWNWVAWVDPVLLPAVSLVAALFVLRGQENADSTCTRPAPPSTYVPCPFRRRTEGRPVWPPCAARRSGPPPGAAESGGRLL